MTDAIDPAAAVEDAEAQRETGAAHGPVQFDGNSTRYTLADFYDLPDKDLFAKTRPFLAFVDDTRARGHYLYRRTLVGPCENRSVIRDQLTGECREMIMMASNNYLGLTTHAKVIAAGRRANEELGAGSGGVPLLAGTYQLHRDLEHSLAALKGCEDAVVFSSGYSSNVGTISALVRRNDITINDKLNHASLIDGCRFTGAMLRTYKHNDMNSLEKVLRSADREYDGKLVIVDGVFSMDGDICKLPEIVALCRRYGARLMIDEAHATGVIGPRGGGTPDHFGMEGQVDIVAGTLSKALGVVGGFVASTRAVCEYIRIYARSYMFSTSLPPAATASLIAAVEVIRTEPALRERLHENIGYMHTNLKSLGFDIGPTETAIVPILVGEDAVLREMSREIHEAGIFLNPVYFPAVPKRLSRLRLSLMATHTREDLDLTLNALDGAGRKYGIIR
jgi:glycine C-acetyltransferase